MRFTADAQQKIRDMEYLRTALYGPFGLPLDGKFLRCHPDNSLVGILRASLDYGELFEIYQWLDTMDSLFPGGNIEKILTGNALNDCLIHEVLKTTRAAVDRAVVDHEIGDTHAVQKMVKTVVSAWENHYPGFSLAVRDRIARPPGKSKSI